MKEFLLCVLILMLREMLSRLFLACCLFTIYCCLVYWLGLSLGVLVCLHRSVQLHKVGEHVLARWTDSNMYPGQITAINILKGKLSVSFS